MNTYAPTPSLRSAISLRRGPLAGNYLAAAAMVMLALIPYLALSAALGPITPLIAHRLHMTAQTMSLTTGMANAGYAVGTIVAVLLAQHLPQRRMMVLYASLLVAGSVLAAAATTSAPFIAGHVLQGLSTSLLLIAALPPLIVGQPLQKMRPTSMILNMAIFGAIALGPLLGGAEASAHAWRPLLWSIAGVAAVALVLALLTFEDAPAADPTARRDLTSVGLAAAGSVAAFYGVSELTTHAFLGWTTFAPLVGGLALIVAMIAHQFRSRHPLLDVRGLVTTIPVAAIITAITAAAASVSAVSLVSIALAHRFSPMHVGLYMFPEFGGAVLTAVLLGVLFRKRGIHYLALGGMLSLSAGILVISRLVPATPALTIVGSALIGLGVGGSVAPAMFLTGYSVAATNLQRVYALVELLRGLGAFLVAPIILHFAGTVGGSPTSGTSTALWITFGISAGGALIAVALYMLGGVRPQAPDVERWFASQRPGGGEPAPALSSPSLLAAVHRESRRRRRRRRPGGPAIEESRTISADAAPRPVLLTFDGSRVAGEAIRAAARELGPGRRAVVVTVWEPFNVDFLPEPGTELDAANPAEVGNAAAAVARKGAALAEAAGFRAESTTVRAAPTWRGIVDAANEHDASLIVLGSHGHGRLPSALIGSVARAVATNAVRPVLIVRDSTSRSHVLDELSSAASTPEIMAQTVGG